MSDGFELYQEVIDAKRMLDIGLKEAKARGQAMNAAEARYYAVKDTRVRELMEDGMSGTVISMLIKGEPEVNAAMNKFLDLQVEYKNACEGIQVYKRWFDFLSDQYQREWTKTGRD